MIKKRKITKNLLINFIMIKNKKRINKFNNFEKNLITLKKRIK